MRYINGDAQKHALFTCKWRHFRRVPTSLHVSFLDGAENGALDRTEAVRSLTSNLDPILCIMIADRKIITFPRMRQKFKQYAKKIIAKL